MKYKPLNDSVLIKPPQPDEMTKSGILKLTEVAEAEVPDTGIVIAVGELVPETIKVGDNVVFKKYAPDELPTEDDERLLVIKPEDIIAKIC